VQYGLVQLSNMHIIAGIHRSRVLAPLADKQIRPTSARVREALFNILMHRLRDDDLPFLLDARFADICCGSGAIGLEALSRGAAHVTFVDSSPAALYIARRNAEMLREAGRCSFVQADASRLPRAPVPYGLLFADPPYDASVLSPLMDGLVREGWVHGNSLLITEQRQRSEPIVHPAFTLVETRKYGESVLRMYEVTLGA
jgi:16S rRNA (guanine966-N2)-methyltransferase